MILYLANFTRKSASGTGPIAQIDLSNAFIAAAGFAPNDESSIMLQRLPSLVRCDTEDFEPLATTAVLKKARLSESQKPFVEMMRKIFFQPGAGRKEAALLREMGASANKQLGKKY